MTDIAVPYVLWSYPLDVLPTYASVTALYRGRLKQCQGYRNAVNDRCLTIILKAGHDWRPTSFGRAVERITNDWSR